LACRGQLGTAIAEEPGASEIPPLRSSPKLGRGPSTDQFSFQEKDVSPKSISHTTLALALMGVSSNLAAQEAQSSLGISSSDGMDADASADGPSDSDGGSGRPLQRPFEIGVFAGVLFPPEGHSLRDWDEPYQDYAPVALDVGLRAGFFPIDYVGIEGEVAAMPTTTENDNNANLFALRAHLIGQLPTKYITPFLVVGGGRWMLDSDALGQDADRAFHFGIGAKVPDELGHLGEPLLDPCGRERAQPVRDEVFWGKRVNQHAWQFPQGGIKHGETPERAMYRELE
jgi:hypothetical protein